MSLYSNINAYKQISSMYPRWYLDVYEMREIIRIEALVASNMQRAIDLILDNHFIDTLDENKASELESYLNIAGVSDRPIEERRAIIRTYFLGRGKLSLSQIIAIVEALSGGKCTGTFLQGDSYNNHYIKLKILDCDIKYMLLDIISTLSSRVPAHLWVELYYTPKKVEMNYNYLFGAKNGLQSNASTSGEWNNQTIPAINHYSVSARSNVNSSVAATINILYGGNLDSIYEDTVNGGTLQSLNEQTYNGNY